MTTMHLLKDVRLQRAPHRPPQQTAPELSRTELAWELEAADHEVALVGDRAPPQRGVRQHLHERLATKSEHARCGSCRCEAAFVSSACERASAGLAAAARRRGLSARVARLAAVHDCAGAA